MLVSIMRLRGEVYGFWKLNRNVCRTSLKICVVKEKISESDIQCATKEIRLAPAWAMWPCQLWKTLSRKYANVNAWASNISFLWIPSNFRHLNLKSHTPNPVIVSSLAWNAVRDCLTKSGKWELVNYIESVKVTDTRITIKTGKPIVNMELTNHKEALRERIEESFKTFEIDKQREKLCLFENFCLCFREKSPLSFSSHSSSLQNSTNTGSFTHKKETLQTENQTTQALLDVFSQDKIEDRDVEILTTPGQKSAR